MNFVKAPGFTGRFIAFIPLGNTDAYLERRTPGLRDRPCRRCDSRQGHPLAPSLQKAAQGLGQRIELARCRRDLSASLFAERIGVDPKTLARLEAGDPGVSLGS